MLLYFHFNFIYSKYGEQKVEGYGVQLQGKSLTALLSLSIGKEQAFPPVCADSYFCYYKKNEFLGKQNKRICKIQA